MKHYDLSAEQIETVNHKHIYAVDKLYRMHAGISSKLISVIRGFALLEVYIHPGWKKSNEVTAKQFIESWSHNPEIQNLDGWEVRIFSSRKIAGFTISANEAVSADTRGKIDLYNAKSEPHLVYVYKVHNDGVKLPVIQINDWNKIYNLEFVVRDEFTKCVFFDLKDKQNYVISNNNVSGNLFFIPDTEDDYLLIRISEYAKVPGLKMIKASRTPVSYSFHSKLFYLINMSREDSAFMLWKEMLNRQIRNGINIETRNFTFEIDSL